MGKRKNKTNRKKNNSKKFDLQLLDYKSKPFMFILVAVCCTVYFIITLNQEHIQDDSFIFFRYAQNFVNGNGLVFNVGEQVEGFTGFLWLFILIILSFIGFDLVGSAVVISILFGGLTIFYTFKLSALLHNLNNYEYSSHNLKYSYFDLVPVFLLSLNGAIHYWASSGMETLLFSLLITISFYYYFLQKFRKKSNYYYAYFLMLASFTRPEGLMVIIILLLNDFFWNYKKKDFHFRVSVNSYFSKYRLKSICIMIIPTIILTIFRFIYFGYPLPNTFYAKSGISFTYLSTGLIYFFEFLSSYLLFGVLFVLPLGLLKFTKLKQEITLLLSTILLYTGYIILIGGDVLPVNRFFIPLLPLIYVLIGLVFREFYHLIKNSDIIKSPQLSNTILIFLLVALGYYTFTNNREHIKIKSKLEDNLVQKMTATGKWLKFQQSLGKNKLVVAASTIGALSYNSESTVIDMLGLTDEVIAHNPKPIEEISDEIVGWKERNYNVEYLLSREPDYICFSTGIKPSAYAERALFTSEKFINEYYAYIVYYPPQNLRTTVYKRKPKETILFDSKTFASNPNFDIEYVNLYTRFLNLMEQSEKVEETINLCYELKEIAPLHFGETYRMLGELYARLGNNQLALENYERAIMVDKFNTTAWGSLLSYYLRVNDQNKINYYKYVLRELNPDILLMYGLYN